jgi:LysR family glycine cleavage system transcriptional activator
LSISRCRSDRALVHCYWSPSDREAPTWERWLAAARSQGADLPAVEELKHLSFREELHAIEAVIAGQGIAICSDVLVARELATGVLVKALNLALPGYGFYLVHTPSVQARRAGGQCNESQSRLPSRLSSSEC